eukprot:1554047-Rhodomonas_salina.2
MGQNQSGPGGEGGQGGEKKEEKKKKYEPPPPPRAGRKKTKKGPDSNARLPAGQFVCVNAGEQRSSFERCGVVRF